MSTIGLIGLGEAGTAIAAGLNEEARAQVVGYDPRQADPTVRAAAEQAGVMLLDSVTAVVEAAEIVISLTKANVAVRVAEDAAPALTARHIYADYNSSSPEVKRAVAATVAQTGARFVDGAVMSAVPPKRHRVPVLASGDGADDFGVFATGLGMEVEVIGDEPGQASAVKMFRSLLVKGLEALVLECAVGAHRHGIDGRVFASMPGDLPVDDWTELASYLIGRTVVHGERRAAELREVAATLADAGVAPLLAEAGAARLQWAADQGLRERFGGQPPLDYTTVLEALEKGGQS
jgi:3-hydroxyisobutyrate dehydrogenase-like beta-hydroxyacid dehydrogenase